MGEQKDTESGVIPLLCTVERPMAVPSQTEYTLVFPHIRGDMDDLVQIEPRGPSWSGQLTERWLFTQCCQLATSLSAIHRIAALKVPHLPRLRFLRSGRLATDVIKWLSRGETDLGTLVFSNFSTEPPTPAEAPPEYFINLNRPRKQRKTDIRRSSISQKSHESDCGSANIEPKEEGETELRESSIPFPASPSSTMPYTSDDRPDDAQKTGSREAIPEKAVSTGSIRASKLQVWCLGTVWLKLITWFLLGPEGIKDRQQIFNPPAHTSGFVERVIQPEDGMSLCPYRMKRVVKELIHELNHHKRSTDYIGRLLKLISSRMLVEDAGIRASSQQIVKRLQGWQEQGLEGAGAGEAG